MTSKLKAWFMRRIVEPLTGWAMSKNSSAWRAEVAKKEQALAEAKKQGAKELAEWAEEICAKHGTTLYRMYCEICWSAKIKELGL